MDTQDLDGVPSLDGYELVKPIVPTQIGLVVSFLINETKALKTVMRQHTAGFSITQYRRSFMHNGQVEIPGTSQWHVARHQEWSSKVTYDWLHVSMRDVDPVGVPGDKDD